MQDPLDPRDAFYGSRTNAIKLYHRVRDEEEIRYDDFTSPQQVRSHRSPCVLVRIRYHRLVAVFWASEM